MDVAQGEGGIGGSLRATVNAELLEGRRGWIRSRRSSVDCASSSTRIDVGVAIEAVAQSKKTAVVVATDGEGMTLSAS